jgi:type I restriction enzyme R subunit
LKWIERFEKQLLQETILQKEDLNREPFKIDGGFDRLNKIFNSELDQVIEVINENLYITA